MAVLQKIKLLLSSRFASYFILLISIAGRIIQKIHFTDTGGDKAAQIEATRNFWQGHGISVKEVSAIDLSQVHYTPLIKWPPGYSLLLSPFYKLCNENFFWGSLWLDVLTCILFIWFARKILLLFELPAHSINLYVLVTGFFVYTFAIYTSTDLIAHVFFEIAIYLALRFILHKKTSYSGAFIIALMLFMSGLTRYLFIPAAFVIPAYFILTGLLNQNKLFISRGFFMLLTLLVMVGGLLLFQRSSAGEATYVLPSEKGFFPGQVTRMHPFLFTSALNQEAALVQAEKYTQIPYLTIGRILLWIHFIFFIVCLCLFARWTFKQKLPPSTLIDHFIYINTFSCLAIIAVLGFLSATHAAVIVMPPSTTWSFIDEGRYYSLPVFFVQQLLFILVFLYRAQIKNWLFRCLLIAMAVLFINVFHGAYYTTKKIAAYPSGFYQKQADFDFLDTYRSLLKKTISENPGQSLVVCSDNYLLNSYAVLWEDVPGLEDFEKLNSNSLRSQKGTILFVTLRSRNNYKLTGFLANPNKKLVGRFRDYSFYTLYVAPGTP